MKLIIEIPEVYYNYTKKYHDLSYIEKDVLIEALMKGTRFEEDEDCISRSDAIEFFKDDVYVVNELNNLVSVHPKQRTGRWIDNKNGTYTCDSCGCKHSRSKFCPNCGARLSGGESNG